VRYRYTKQRFITTCGPTRIRCLCLLQSLLGINADECVAGRVKLINPCQ
jgi:hypothetical protein